MGAEQEPSREQVGERLEITHGYLTVALLETDAQEFGDGAFPCFENLLN
jgi:hypothetical protein